MSIVDPVYVQRAPAEEFWTITVILALGTLVCLLWFARKLKHARLIEDTPTSKIRSAAQGFVELEGIARPLDPENPILSPLSQTPCHWFEFKIMRKVTNGKKTSWRVVQSGRSPAPIILDDNTGQCLLKPGSANLHTTTSNTWYGTSRHPSQLSIERKDSLIQFGNYRYSESLIPMNSPLYALGYFKTVRANDDFQKEKAIAEIIREWKTDQEALVERFDRNGDGTVDEQEWKLVRLAANLEAEDLEHKLNIQADIHTMEKPKNKAPYLISTEDQSTFTNTLKWHYRIAMVASIAMLYSTSWMLIQRFA